MAGNHGLSSWKGQKTAYLVPQTCLVFSPRRFFTKPISRRNRLGSARVKPDIQGMIAYKRLAFLLLISSISLLMMHCKRTKYICPAYQSAFLIVEEKKDFLYTVDTMGKPIGMASTFFPYFEDSMPVMGNFAPKNAFGVIIPMKKKKKLKMWATVPMILVLPIDSSAKDSLDSAASDTTDVLEGAEDGEPKEDEEDKPSEAKPGEGPPPGEGTKPEEPGEPKN